MKFYNFVCSGEGSEPRTSELGDNEADREIISFYVRYHHLLSRNDTTGSNALIGSWQKQLGHRKLWEDFNLEYEGGAPPKSGGRRTRPRPARAATRKSTGCISAPNPTRRVIPLPRRRSAEYRYFSDSSLTPLSSDNEDSRPQFTTMRLRSPPPPLSGGDLSCPIQDPLPEGSKDCLARIMDQDISRHRVPRDKNMDPTDVPPPTPPQDIGVPIDPLYCEPADSTASLAGVVDDPMNGTSVSAMCLRSGRELSLSVTKPKDTKSLSAPVPRSSSAPRTKRKHKNNWSTKGKRKKVDNAEETTVQPMVIDTPTVAGPEPEPEPLTVEPVHQDIAQSEPFIPGLDLSEPPSLKISILPSVPIPPIVQEFRVPFSTSRPNIPLPQPAPASNPEPPPAALKGLSDTRAAATGVSRPVLPSNPPIWAQVRAVHNSGGAGSNRRLVASRALRILQLLQVVPKWCLF